jgi:hypothetical protein
MINSAASFNLVYQTQFFIFFDAVLGLWENLGLLSIFLRAIGCAGGKKVAMTKKAPNPTDKHVGSRVRMRRMMLGMSQEKLGDSLDLTFQPVQKYE